MEEEGSVDLNLTAKLGKNLRIWSLGKFEIRSTEMRGLRCTFWLGAKGPQETRCLDVV